MSLMLCVNGTCVEFRRRKCFTPSPSKIFRLIDVPVGFVFSQSQLNYPRRRRRHSRKKYVRWRRRKFSAVRRQIFGGVGAVGFLAAAEFGGAGV
jgi:hypothetical protein